MHNLLGLSFCFLNFLPGLSLFHFQESNTIGKQFCIVSCFFLIQASFLQVTSDLVSLLVILLILVALLPVVLTIVLLFIHFMLLFIAELLVGRVLLSLWNWLVLFRRLDLIDVLLVVVH